MKKIVLTMAMFATMTGIAMADGNAFTPLNFNDTQYGNPAPTSTTAATSTAKKVATQAASSVDGDAVGNGNIQNAILQLDNAQVDIRNDLLNCKTKYADVDAQYKLIKTERQALKKQVRTVEKRIKEIDRAKEKIRKNML